MALLDVPGRLTTHARGVTARCVEVLPGSGVRHYGKWATPYGYVHIVSAAEAGELAGAWVAARGRTGELLWTWRPPGEQGQLQRLSVEPDGDVWVICVLADQGERPHQYYRLDGSAGAVKASATVTGVVDASADTDRIFYVRRPEGSRETPQTTVGCGVIRDGQVEQIWQFGPYRGDWGNTDILTRELVLIGGEEGLWRLDPDTGDVVWFCPGLRAHEYMPVRGKNLLVTLGSGELAAVRLDNGERIWRRVPSADREYWWTSAFLGADADRRVARLDGRV